jgi:hypothetical protein
VPEDILSQASALTSEAALAMLGAPAIEAATTT